MNSIQQICPYNCYCGCGLEVKVNHGEIVSIEGDLKHPYNQGFICAKANSFLLRQYHSQRISYPLVKQKHKKNSWQRISWDEALNLIAKKIGEIHRNGDYRQLYLDKFSGNMGLQNRAIDYLLEDLGSITRIGNDLCYSAGLEGISYLFGKEDMPNPKEMAKVKLIILWGANPVYTAFSQSIYLQQAKDRGAKIIVIDPFYSASATFAHDHIVIKPGTDGALALGIAKYLVEQGLWDGEYVEEKVIGFAEYREYLATLSYEWIEQETGVDHQKMVSLARIYSESESAAIWLGFGMQRYSNGGQTVRIIGTLPPIAGKMSKEGEGLYYSQQQTSSLLNAIAKKKRGMFYPTNSQSMDWILTNNQPVKLGLFVNTNPIAQFPDSNQVRQFVQQIEFMVTIDQFFTPTAQESDLILPAATFGEREDLLGGYWHKYIGYSQKAVEPWQESKSEFHIAKELSKKLKDYQVNTTIFDDINTEGEFLESFFGPIVEHLEGVKDFEQLKQGGYYLLQEERDEKEFPTLSGKIELLSQVAKDNGYDSLPRYLPPQKKDNQYRLVTFHSNVFLNSQFANIDFLSRYQGKEDALYIHPNIANRHSIKDGELVRVYNRLDEITLRVKVIENIADDVLFYQQGNKGKKQIINQLIPLSYTDMGGRESNLKGIAYHDTFVHITRV